MFNSSHHYENKEFETNKHFRDDHYRICYYFNKLLLFQDNNNKTIFIKNWQLQVIEAAHIK